MERPRNPVGRRARPHKALTRRQFLRRASGLVTLPILAACDLGDGSEVPTADADASAPPVVESVPGYDNPNRWAGREITIASSGDDGGLYQEAQVEAIFEPFQRLTGAEIRVVRTDLEELRRQVASGEVDWSVADIPTDEVLPLANSGVIAEIEYSAIGTKDLFEPFLMEHGVGASLYSTVLSFREDLLENGRFPATWSDFWDLDRFPGLRGLQENPTGTLEFALLADGVPQEELYPLNVNRALAKLDEIRESITLWWRQGAQATQSIAAGDVVMVSAWHDRILALGEEGAPVGLSWEGSAINGASWVIPVGAPEYEMALDFINFATRAEVSAAFSRLVPFGPVNLAAYELLPPEYSTLRPGAPGLARSQFTLDFEWWFLNREDVQSLFQEWLDAALG